MTRQRAVLALLLTLALLPSQGRAAEPATGASTPSLDLGCAIAKAVDLGTLCSELALFKREPEARMGEQLAQLLDAPARTRAVGLIEAEQAERKAKGTKGCTPARPLCAFSDGALAALREGLGDGK